MCASGFLSVESSVQSSSASFLMHLKTLADEFLWTLMLHFSPQWRSGQRAVAGAVVTPGCAACSSGTGTHTSVAQGLGQGLDCQCWISTVSNCLLQSLFLSSFIQLISDPIWKCLGILMCKNTQENIVNSSFRKWILMGYHINCKICSFSLYKSAFHHWIKKNAPYLVIGWSWSHNYKGSN